MVQPAEQKCCVLLCGADFVGSFFSPFVSSELYPLNDLGLLGETFSLGDFGALEQYGQISAIVRSPKAFWVAGQAYLSLQPLSGHVQFRGVDTYNKIYV